MNASDTQFRNVAQYPHIEDILWAQCWVGMKYQLCTSLEVDGLT